MHFLNCKEMSLQKCAEKATMNLACVQTSPISFREAKEIGAVCTQAIMNFAKNDNCNSFLSAREEDYPLLLHVNKIKGELDNGYLTTHLGRTGRYSRTVESD